MGAWGQIDSYIKERSADIHRSRALQRQRDHFNRDGRSTADARKDCILLSLHDRINIPWSQESARRISGRRWRTNGKWIGRAEGAPYERDIRWIDYSDSGNVL